ncbi:hypothetical protein D3C87_2099070 [compost metagenome]
MLVLLTTKQNLDMAKFIILTKIDNQHEYEVRLNTDYLIEYSSKSDERARVTHGSIGGHFSVKESASDIDAKIINAGIE